MPQYNRLSYTYTQLFCEENIWKLIESLYTNQLAKPIDVLFILNKTQTIALYGQKLSSVHKPIIWDYHVILTAQTPKGLRVFDFDSRCEFPLKLSDYFDLTFPLNIRLDKPYQPYIKAIKANYFLQHFYSDRKHMQGFVKNSEFPEYDIITPTNNIEKLTLEQCRNTQQALDLGHYSPSSKLLLPKEYLALINANDE